jgi:hypothetical protein
MLMVFAGSYQAAWDIVEQRNTRSGIAIGIASGMMGVGLGAGAEPAGQRARPGCVGVPYPKLWQCQKHSYREQIH